MALANICRIIFEPLVHLSVNINKIATLRNARGGAIPDLLLAAKRIEGYGAKGITVHPRPDERHIRYSDVRQLAPILTTEFNIEGYPTEDFLLLVEEVRPAQVTLVPDPPHVLTSNAGWDVLSRSEELKDILQRLKESNIRTSLFLDPDPKQVEAAANVGTHRIELYTESYASGFELDKENAIAPFVVAAKEAALCGLGLNAGHDLSLQNLLFFAKEIPGLLEVSIGHALISDALYFGLENAVRMYQRQLELAEVAQG